MEKNRFILRYRGSGPIPSEDLDRVKSSKDIEVLDSTSRMMLVEGSPGELDQLFGSRSEWLLTPERTIDLPDARPKIKKDLNKDD